MCGPQDTVASHHNRQRRLLLDPSLDPAGLIPCKLHQAPLAMSVPSANLPCGLASGRTAANFLVGVNKQNFQNAVQARSCADLQTSPTESTERHCVGDYQPSSSSSQIFLRARKARRGSAPSLARFCVGVCTASLERDQAEAPKSLASACPRCHFANRERT